MPRSLPIGPLPIGPLPIGLPPILPLPIRLSRVRGLLLPVLLLALLVTSCGGGAGAAPAADPFDIQPPDARDGDTAPSPTPAPLPPRAPVFEADAWVHHRTVPYGAFPSDVVLYGSTLFTTDADQIGPDGLTVVPLDISAGDLPTESAVHVPTTIYASDLVDSQGAPADVDVPIGFGFFANDLVVIQDSLACLLVNAGGSDLSPTLSNLVVFDPTTGAVRQVVDLANRIPATTGAADSWGRPLPPEGFRQSGAEGLAFVPTGPQSGLLYVAMVNLIFSAPSSGAAKYPGTVQVFSVDLSAPSPIGPVSDGSFTTKTLDVQGYNPVAVAATPVQTGGSANAGSWRVLVTVAGTTGYDANGKLVPITPASVVTYDGATGTYLGRFGLGRVGLAATRPALGRDAAGHRVGFFPSAVTGEVYLLRLDGLHATPVDATRLAILRGPGNGIPVTAAQAGGPGGNITGVGLAPDGRTLVIAGFGDLFTLPTALPGRLFLLNLPENLVTGAEFGTNFVPGSTLYGAVPGRALGGLVLAPNAGTRPDVYVAVSSPIDTTTWIADGPASLGTLQTFGLIR